MLTVNGLQDSGLKASLQRQLRVLTVLLEQSLTLMYGRARSVLAQDQQLCVHKAFKVKPLLIVSANTPTAPKPYKLTSSGGSSSDP